MPFVNPKFDGKNFLEWSKTCTLVLKSHRMVKYINGKAIKPAETDSNFDDWDCENAMVKSWLLNSMEPCIRNSYIFLTTADGIWKSITKTYSFSSIMIKKFEVKQKLSVLTQGERTVTEYYSDLTLHWLELDHYTLFECDDAVIMERYQKIVNEDRVMKYLQGLSVDYDYIKNQLVRQVPFPTVEEAHRRVQLEETRIHVMAPASAPAVDRSALVAGKLPGSDSRRTMPSSTLAERVPIVCDYCNRPYHTRETCYSLHPHLLRRERGRGGSRGRGRSRGYLGAGRSFGRDGNVHFAAMEDTHSVSESDLQSTLSSESFSAAEVNTLRQLMARMDSSSAASTSMANAGLVIREGAWSW